MDKKNKNYHVKNSAGKKYNEKKANIILNASVLTLVNNEHIIAQITGIKCTASFFFHPKTMFLDIT